jgi:hypothetical protein
MVVGINKLESRIGFILVCTLSLITGMTSNGCAHSQNTTEIPPDTMTIEMNDMNFVIPDYQPMDVAYSKWQSEREKQLLAVNAYGDDRQEWIRACTDSFVLIRMAGIYLLTENPQDSDREVYRAALNDIEYSVRALAAYGLVQLGEKEYMDIIRQVAGIRDGVSLCVYQAAGLLGSLNETDAFEVIRKGVQSSYETARIASMHNAYRFLSHWESLNLDAFYTDMLAHDDPRVRLIARMQLEELDTEASKSLLGH